MSVKPDRPLDPAYLAAFRQEEHPSLERMDVVAERLRRATTVNRSRRRVVIAVAACAASFVFAVWLRQGTTGWTRASDAATHTEAAYGASDAPRPGSMLETVGAVGPRGSNDFGSVDVSAEPPAVSAEGVPGGAWAGSPSEVDPRGLTATTSVPRPSASSADASRGASTSLGSRLAEETAVARQFRAALDANAYGEVERLVELHRGRYPTGAFTEERDWIEVQALCRTDRLRDAARAVAAFESNYPRSHLRSTLTANCEFGDGSR